MTHKNILDIYHKANECISWGRIAEAFFLIKKIIYELPAFDLQVKLEQYSNIYNNLLSYKILVPDDKSQESIKQKLTIDMFALNNQVKELALINFSNNFEYQKLRAFQANYNSFFMGENYSFDKIIVLLQANNIAMMDLPDNPADEVAFDSTANSMLDEHQKLLGFVFYHIFLTEIFSDNEIDVIKNIVSNPKIAICFRCVAIAALTLNTMRCFDIKKANAILAMLSVDDLELRQRLLVGLVLIISRHGRRLDFEDFFTNQLKFLLQEKGVVNELQSIIFQIIRTTETESLTKHIREEIMPEMFRMSPMIRKQLEEMENDDDDDQVKPKLEDMFDKIGLSDKIQEFGELQMSGSDVYASTFAQMKGFPFFSLIENWFVPFDENNPFFRGFFANRKTLSDVISSNPMLCNSDKYSLAFTLLHSDKKQLNSMSSAMVEEKSQIDEMMSDLKKKSDYEDYKVAANHYILDLYRFYSFFPYHNDFDTSLNEIIFLIENHTFGLLFDSPELKNNIANFYFRYNHYMPALKIYMSDQNKSIAIEKNIGYCNQQLENYEAAINHYTIANGEDKNDAWTLRRMAFCFRKIGNYIEAANCYKRVLEKNKEDIKLISRLAMCYIEAKEYELALPLLYNVDYLNSEYPKIKSLLLWTLYQCGRLEQAAELASKFLEQDTADIQDLIIGGHVSLLTGDKMRAIDLYKRAIMKSKNMSEFLALFRSDSQKVFENDNVKEWIYLVIETVLMSRFSNNKT